MNASRRLRIPIAALVLVPALAGSAAAQTTGADRYMRSAQSSLGRADGMIASIAPNYVTPMGGGMGMIGATQQSFDRTTAAMQSMLANREATVRGLGQAAVYRTPDNLYGVYWQNYYMRRAQMRSVYFEMAMSQGRPVFPLHQVYEEEMVDNARRRLQEQARGEELSRRFDRYSPDLPPNPGIFPPETILNDVPGADLIRRDQALQQQRGPADPQPGPRRRPRRN